MKNLSMQELRLRSKKTQKQVAKEIGVTTDYISLLERGLRNPSDTLKKKLAQAYSTDVVEIFLATQSTKCTIQK